MKNFYALTFAIMIALSTQAQIVTEGQPVTAIEAVARELATTVPSEQMPYIDIAALEAEDVLRALDPTKPFRFGYNIDVNLGLSNAGQWEELSNGARVWRLRIVSPGAYSLNFQFDDYNLPEGATLFLYNDDRSQMLGALTAANNKAWGTLGTTIVQGEAVTLEYFEPGSVRGMGALNLGVVTHGYRKMEQAEVDDISRDFGDSGDCNINTICAVGDDWRDQIRSVAVIVVNGNESCTGAMINNTCNDTTPYFLTADHCLGGNVGNWVFRFNWDSPTCTPDANGPQTQTVSGATLRANNDNSDFALLELSSQPPSAYDVFYAGWDASGATPSGATAIHHPSGDVKKISFENDPLIATPWGGAETWNVDIWDLGTTEPGSSGSPLFSPDGLIVGQLYGGTASCNLPNDPDYYGRFDVSWNAVAGNANQLEPWLDGCATGVTDLPGLGADLPTVNSDAATTSINNLDALVCGENSATPAVKLRNRGLDTLVSANVQWQLDGGNVINVPWTGSLAYNEEETVSLGTISFNTGTHELKVWSDTPNTLADEDNSNDTTLFVFEANTAGESFALELQTDYYGSETTFEIVDGLGAVVEQGGPYNDGFGGTLVNETFCLAPDCYTYIIYDQGGDGMAGVFWAPTPGYYSLTNGSATVIVDEEGASFTDEQQHFFCAGLTTDDASASGIGNVANEVCGDSTVSPSVLLINKGIDNLTDAEVKWQLDGGAVTTIPWTGILVFNQAAVVQLGSIACSAGSHVLTVWSDNPNGNADQINNNDTATFAFNCTPTGETFSLELQTDFYASEVTWELADQSGSLVASGGPWFNTENGYLHEEDICLADECYTFSIFDDGNNGMAGSVAFPGVGDYTLSDSQGTVVASASGTDYTNANTHLLCAANATPDSTQNDASTTGATGVRNGSCGNGSISPKIGLRNAGFTTLTSATVAWQIDGGAVNTEQWTGSLVFNQMDQIDVGMQTLADGEHTLTMWSESPNGVPDEATGNDTTAITFTLAATGEQYGLVIQTNYYGEEVTWNLTHEDSTIVAEGGPYADAEGGTLVQENLCLAADCYILNIFDAGGDGMQALNWDPTLGFYSLTEPNGTLVVDESGNSYNDHQNHFLCTGGAWPDGVQELPTPSLFRAFPNPFTGLLTLEFQTTGRQQLDIVVRNMIGQPIVQRSSTVEANGTLQLDLSTQPNGVYFVSVGNSNLANHQRVVLAR